MVLVAAVVDSVLVIDTGGERTKGKMPGKPFLRTLRSKCEYLHIL
jgi:hypothetical protein